MLFRPFEVKRTSAQLCLLFASIAACLVHSRLWLPRLLRCQHYTHRGGLNGTKSPLPWAAKRRSITCRWWLPTSWVTSRPRGLTLNCTTSLMAHRPCRRWPATPQMFAAARLNAPCFCRARASCFVPLCCWAARPRSHWVCPPAVCLITKPLKT